MASGIIKRTLPTDGQGILASNVTGELNYSRYGNIVVLSGTLVIGGSFALGATLCSGIPKVGTNNALFWANNNNALNSNYRVFGTNTGTLTAGQAMTSGLSLRITAAYYCVD